MARELSVNLTNEMESTSRNPRSTVTVERFLPEWTAQISGLTGPEYEQYAHGHAVAVYDRPPGTPSGSPGFTSLFPFGLANPSTATTESIIFRARSGSYANPRDGRLYFAVIKDSDLEDPTTWESLWIATSVTGLMHPAWTTESGGGWYGGSIAVATYNNGGTPYGRVFYIRANGYLYCCDVNLSTGAVGISTAIANLGAGAAQMESMQIGCCKYDEVFVLMNQEVEAGLAGWHEDVYGSFIRRYYYSGSWQADNSFFFHTHAEGGLVRDGPDEGSAFTSASRMATTTQWGKRPCGGMGVNNIDDDTVVVSLGMTHWRKWGYDTHAQGIMSFIYHRDSSWWQRNWEADRADFNEDTRLNIAAFARGFEVEGSQFVTWTRFIEPSDYAQTPTGQTIPRTLETVFAKLSDDGKCITDMQYLGDPDDLNAASIVAVNHSGSKKLYAIGWRSVYESDPAALVCDAGDDAVDMADYLNSWTLARNNRSGMTLTLPLFDPSIITAADTLVKSGALAKIDFGNATEQVQVGQGYLDLTTPSLSVSADGIFSENASVVARADKMLQDTRAGWEDAGLPQTVMTVPPDDPVKHIGSTNGYWQVATMTWPDLFFSGTFGDLEGEKCYRLLSFPYANTGGGGGDGDPGKCLTSRKKHMGTWFKDWAKLAQPPMVDGAIEASVRFGDIYDQANFDFATVGGTQVYTTVNRDNGVITHIQWRTGGYSGSIWNTVYQYACMAGLICHAPEIGRKYAFVWEAWSDFSSSSHTDDTWTGLNFDAADYSTHGTGQNKLYLLVSDYDGDDWVHESVAGGITATGLTPGQPADLKMQVLGGTIYCYYRLHSTGTPNQWRFAFSYKAGRFGAGNFGLVGRGHAGIQWDDLYPGVQYIKKCDNYVDFWDIKMSDAVMDEPVESHLRRRCWQGFTETEFVPKTNDAVRIVSSGSYFSYDTPVTNLCIDFKVNIASTREAGVFVRGVSLGAPTNECMKIGLVAHNTANSATNTVYYYAVKRYYVGGAEQAASREYSPIPIQLEGSTPVPVRVTVRGAIYSVWIAGNYAGHFVDETALGLYYGLYATGASATFTDVYVPELYEIPAHAGSQTGESMDQALRRALGKRRIKSYFTWDGKLKFSYFSDHDEGPAFEDTLEQSSYQKNDRFYSVVTVEGANDAKATFTSPVLLALGRRAKTIANPEIYHREHCYVEAQAICAELYEGQVQESFSGIPDIRLDPEDEAEITQSRQNIAGNFLVDDVSINFKMGESPDSKMSVSTRQSVVL